MQDPGLVVDTPGEPGHFVAEKPLRIRMRTRFCGGCLDAGNDSLGNRDFERTGIGAIHGAGGSYRHS